MSLISLKLCFSFSLSVRGVDNGGPTQKMGRGEIIGKGRRYRKEERKRKELKREGEKKEEKKDEKMKKKERGKEKEGRKGKKRNERNRKKEKKEEKREWYWILPKSNHQITRNQYQNSTIFQLLRGHIPPQLPLLRASALSADAPPWILLTVTPSDSWCWLRPYSLLLWIFILNMKQL